MLLSSIITRRLISFLKQYNFISKMMAANERVFSRLQLSRLSSSNLNRTKEVIFCPTGRASTRMTKSSVSFQRFFGGSLAMLIVFSSYATASPTGAPTVACASMTPQHGFQPQTSPSPYATLPLTVLMSY